MIQTVFDQLKPAAAELFQLDGIGKTQHPGDFAGGGFFGVDHHGKPQFLAHKPQLLFIFRVADAGNGMAGADLFGDQAGQNVDLVTGSGGQQKIRTGLKCLDLNVVTAAVTHHTAHVKNIFDTVHAVRVDVDGYDVMSFGRQLLGQGTAHFAQADDHDFHKAPLHTFARNRLRYAHNLPVYLGPLYESLR